MADENGSVVRRLRLREGLAERSGVSVRTIRGIETGTRRNPQLASLVQLADALGLSAGERHALLGALGAATPLLVSESPHLSPVLTPRQVPAGAVGFAGREDYLDRLDALLGSGHQAVVISGAGGVGKTVLALRWTRRVGHRYPDGHLYVNLNGYSSEPPMTPADVLPIFLRALGVAQSAIPLTVAEQGACYRSVLSDKRALIVLDNAAVAGQIRPLLPGSPGCLVLITSRDDLLSLTALDGAQRLVLDVLSTDEAYQALTRAVPSATNFTSMSGDRAGPPQ
ncbi:helix-turn-helix domain-containing protein [Amycolatopsis sp. NPDC005003]